MSSNNLTLQQRFQQEISQKLAEKLNIKNMNAITKLSKIVVNIGVKEGAIDKKNIERASLVLAQITGQKAKITKAKKSIATFKLREGDQIGVMVTLRGSRMYGFFAKLISVVLPRIRDFHGVGRNQFDKYGNYTLGISEYTVFPEIDPGKIENLPVGRQGLEVCIVTTAKNAKEGFALLEALGMPFAKSSGQTQQAQQA